jgi:hypothetical protein
LAPRRPVSRKRSVTRGARNPTRWRGRRLAGYLPWLAENAFKSATIARRLVVIAKAHKAADLDSPTSSLVRRTHAGIRRTIGTAQRARLPRRQA